MSPSLNFIPRLKNKNSKNPIAPKVIKSIGLGNNGKIELLEGLDEKQKKVVMKTAFNKGELKIETEAMEELQTFRKELKKVREESHTPQSELLLLGSSHIAKFCATNEKDSVNLRYIEGSTLNTLFKESQTKPNMEDIYSILVQVTAGLKFINEKMEHNDISSRNIMVDTKGKVKIIDFGRATKDPQKKGEDFYCLTKYVTTLMGENYNKSQDAQYPNLTKFFEKVNRRNYSSPDEFFEKLKSPELKEELKDMMKNNQNPYFQRILKNVLKE